MPQVNIITTQGENAGTMDLLDTVFGVEANNDLIAQAIYVRLQNARLGTRKTKDRGEISGGGSKPWRQKGTGRARHGSTRSPIWVGGGHVHALRPGAKQLVMPRAMRKAALFSALSAKVAGDAFVVVEGLSFEKPTTKTASAVVQKMTDKKKILIVTAGKDEQIEKSMRNLAHVKVREARLLHPLEIVWSDVVLATKESITTITETFAKTA